ncbi:ABC transporter permease [Methylopila musalis]|uniref:ABC transporter permease n=1 Tax=Methylopila musalis TaxID=1134781 RepID=A0ABW3ZAX9_9HYPH
MENLLRLLSFGPGGWGDELLAGLGVTLALALATLPFGLAFGLGVALMQRSRLPALRGLAQAYSNLFRGLPELLTLFIVYYGGQMLLNRLLGLVAPGVAVEIGPFAAGVTALALVFGAYAAEVFAGALGGLPRGQREAALALGLPPGLAFRLVELPQLWRLALPGLANCWAVLLKDTALVSTIALSDLMRETQIAVGATRQPFTFYLVACLIYVALALVSSAITVRLQARAERGVRFAGR